MNVSIVPAPTGALAAAPHADPRVELQRFLDRRSINTQLAYRGDLEAWRCWLDTQAGVPAPTLDAAAAVLCQAHPVRLRAIVLEFGRWQRAEGRTVATALRRLSTLRSLVGAMRRAGCTTNVLDLDAKEVREAVGRRGASRNTAGPGLQGVAALLRVAAAQRDPVLAVRDVAVLWMLLGLGLRRSEVASLRLEHVALDAERPTVSILGKGRDERESLSIPAPTVAALRAWLAVRPETSSDALFVACSTRCRGRALHSGAIYDALRRLSAAAGIDPRAARPHGMRHAFGTLAARATNGDPFRMRAALRHASVATSQLYVDVERDDQGKVASAVAALIEAVL